MICIGVRHSKQIMGNSSPRPRPTLWFTSIIASSPYVCPLAYLKSHSPNFMKYMLTVAMARLCLT